MSNLESSQAQPVQEIKEPCGECDSTGRKHFDNIDKVVDYITRKQEYFDQHLAAIRLWVAEGYILCPYCNGIGYKVVRQ